jgi:hypothetical protein
VLVAGTAIFGERETVGAACTAAREPGQLEQDSPLMSMCDGARERKACHAAWNDWPRANGANMVRRLLRGGHQCVVFDRSPKAVNELVEEKRSAPVRSSTS